MAEPVAYFLTWTCYGTWLPGDSRGWVDKHDASSATPYKEPDAARRSEAASLMTETAVTLDPDQRRRVEARLRETCEIRGWFLHELNVRSNHVHIVLTAPHKTPEAAMQALKANASASLNVLRRREHWWTEGGSKRYLNDQRSLHAAIAYVRDQ